MRTLRETGARPGEVVGLAVEGVDWGNGCARIVKHKTARKGHKRVLYFNSAALAVLESQRTRHGSGPLFRTTRGRAYTVDEITRRMQILSKRVGFRAIAYGAGRHSFATRALCNGVPDTVLAALLGHADTSMVHSHYSHVAENSRVLRAAAEKAGGRPA
jgi:integrase